MDAILNPWKEAATLILVAKTSNLMKMGDNLNKIAISSKIKDQSKDQDHINLSNDLNDNSKLRLKKVVELISKTDYRVMMVKRSSLSSFMASAYVFAGGAFENADFSSKWWQVFEQANMSKEKIYEVVNRISGSRPDIVKNSVTLEDYADCNPDEKNYLLPTDVALRIAAIRETFEETGVLLLANNENDKLVPLSDQDNVNINLSTWREKVRNDANAFIELCSKLNKCPDIWSLYEWSNWLTPISVGHKRFDTIFYICCLENIPKVVLDNREVTNLKWITPVEMLEEHTQERVFLAPPQVYELSRIFHLNNYDKFKQFIINRETKGCERWLPVISTYNDGAISALPNDELYPEKSDLDLIGKAPVRDYPKKLKDLYNANGRLNRIELRGPTSVVVSNLQPTHGHLLPVSYYRNNEELLQLNSKL